MCDSSVIINMILGFLGPIIAVIIAIYSSKSSASETEKKINAMAANNAKEIACIKELERLQAEIATIQLEKELWEMRYRWRQNSHELWDSLDDKKYPFTQYSDIAQSKAQEREEKQNSHFYVQEFYMKQMQSIEAYIKRLNSVREELGLK